MNIFKKTTYKIKEKYRNFQEKEEIVKRRIFVYFFGWIILIGVILFYIAIGKGPFSCAPKIPKADKLSTVEITLPGYSGKKLITEKRNLMIPENKEQYIQILIEQIVKGSKYDNTRYNVPLDLIIRKVWFIDNQCYVDFYASFLEGETNVSVNSENLFGAAVTQTVKKNVPQVNEVIFLLEGVPFKTLWNFRKEEGHDE